MGNAVTWRNIKMPTEGFDIASLLNFTPPRYLCEKCCALLFAQTEYTLKWLGDERYKCPICGIIYEWAEDYPYRPDMDYSDYLAAIYEGKYVLKFHDLLQ